MPTPLCISCGYSLAGLRNDAACPECARPVTDSLRGDLLQFADRGFLTSVRSGLITLAACLCVQGLLTIIASPFSYNATGAVPTSGPLVNGISLLWVLNSFVTVFAVFRFTTPDPALRDENNANTLRVVTRAAACILACVSVVGIIATRQGLVTSTLPAPIVIPLCVASSALVTTHIVTVLLYNRWLASRIVEDVVIKRTPLYVVLVPLLTIVDIKPLIHIVFDLVALALLFGVLTRTHSAIDAILRSTPARTPPA